MFFVLRTIYGLDNNPILQDLQNSKHLKQVLINKLKNMLNKTPGGVNVGCMNGYIQSLWFYVENANLMLTQYSMTNGVTFPC